MENVYNNIETKLGKIFEKKFIKKYSRMPGTGYKNEVYYLRTEGGEYEVTIWRNYIAHISDGFYDDFSFRPWAEAESERIEFGRRAAKLAQAHNVPWEIAALAAHLPDGEADAAIEAMATAPIPTEEEEWELLDCGIGRRSYQISQLIGEEVFKNLRCKSQNATRILANYLVNG